MIEIEVLQVGDYKVIRLSGNPQGSDPIALQGQVLSLANGAASVAVDMGRLDSLPNFLVIPLIALRNSLDDPAAVVTLVNAPSDFRFRLQVAKIDHLFQFTPSLDNLEGNRLDTPETAASSNSTTDILPILAADRSNPLLNRPVISDILHKDKKTQ